MRSCDSVDCIIATNEPHKVPVESGEAECRVAWGRGVLLQRKFFRETKLALVRGA